MCFKKKPAVEPVMKDAEAEDANPFGDFHFTLTDERTKKELIAFARPDAKDYFSYQNLNLAYGVADERKRAFATMIHYMSQAIMRDGRDVDEAVFALFIGGLKIRASCTLSGSKVVSLSTTGGVFRKEAMQAIRCYESLEMRCSFEEEQKKHDPEFSLIMASLAEHKKFEAEIKAKQGKA